MPRLVVQPTEGRHSQAIQLTDSRSVWIRKPNVSYNKEEYDLSKVSGTKKIKISRSRTEKGSKGDVS